MLIKKYQKSTHKQTHTHNNNNNNNNNIIKQKNLQNFQ